MRSEFKLKDSDGNIYIAYETPGRNIKTDHLGKHEQPLNGLGGTVLADGRDLSATADPNVFVIVATGEILTRA
jgi:hypothetical protein